MHQKFKDIKDISTERFVLSGLCQYGKQALVDIEDIVVEDTFFDAKNQALYKILKHILSDNDKVDQALIISVSGSLNLREYILANDDDVKFIRSLFSFPINLESVRPSAAKLAKLQFARKGQAIAQDIFSNYSNVTGEESFDELCSLAEEKLYELTSGISGEQTPVILGEEVEEYLNFLEHNVTENVGVPTQLKIWNELLGGGLMTGVHLVGARPKVGKSTFAQNVGLFIAQNGIPVLNLDTEMSKKEQMDKVLACLSGVNIRNIKTGQYSKNPNEVIAIKNAAKEFKKLPYSHISVAGKPFTEILSIIRRWITREVGQDANGNWNHCLVIYDYFKLMDENQLNKMQEYQAIGFQISKLSDFTKKYDFPCLAFVQLNRDGITKDTSDILSQSDRLLWLCVSCSILKRKSPEELVEDSQENGTHKLLPLEVRHGTLLDYGDYINIHFDGALSRLKEVGTKFNTIKGNSKDVKDGDILF